MKVWRIQNSRGNGPYNNFYDWADHPHVPPQNPGPHNEHWSKPERVWELVDTLAESNYKGKFGFKTLRQAFAWFTRRERHNLARLGYCLRKVEAVEVVEGDKQVLFVPAQAQMNLYE